MPDGSEFHTAGAATLKPQEAKVVRTRGETTGWCLQSVDRVWESVNQEASGGKHTSGAESVVGQRGKSESYALLNSKPI